MINKIKKFFYTLMDFIFCLQMIRNGIDLNTGNRKVTNFKELWKYCEQWEEGTL